MLRKIILGYAHIEGHMARAGDSGDFGGNFRVSFPEEFPWEILKIFTSSLNSWLNSSSLCSHFNSILWLGSSLSSSPRVCFLVIILALATRFATGMRKVMDGVPSASLKDFPLLSSKSGGGGMMRFLRDLILWWVLPLQRNLNLVAGALCLRRVTLCFNLRLRLWRMVRKLW